MQQWVQNQKFQVISNKVPIICHVASVRNFRIMKDKFTSMPTYCASYAVHNIWKPFHFMTKMMLHMNYTIPLRFHYKFLYWQAGNLHHLYAIH